MASDDLPREARTAFPERGYTRPGGSGVSRDADSRTSTLEKYIAEELGKKRLSGAKNKTELRRIKGEIANLEKRLIELRIRKVELEGQLKG